MICYLQFRSQHCSAWQGGQLPSPGLSLLQTFYPKQPNMDSAPSPISSVCDPPDRLQLDNGGTAIRPITHKLPRYPDDKEDFTNMLSNGRKGWRCCCFAGALQHCAMPKQKQGTPCWHPAAYGSCLHQTALRPCWIMSLRMSRLRATTQRWKGSLALEHPYQY